jgi:thiol-disulfide isomerase/thioredoxin
MTGTDSFMLLNTKSKSHKVTLSNNQVIFHRNKKAIVLINLFATWCPPCIGELAYMNSLNKKYSDDLLLVGILTNDYIDIPSLESFIAKHGINYFISNSPHNNAFSGRLARTLQLPQNFSIPLTVMYVDGKYFTHYEGSVPVEMIEYDIQQAQKQLKLKSNEN